jgi:hypothetical protein
MIYKPSYDMGLFGVQVIGTRMASGPAGLGLTNLVNVNNGIGMGPGGQEVSSLKCVVTIDSAGVVKGYFSAVGPNVAPMNCMVTSPTSAGAGSFDVAGVFINQPAYTDGGLIGNTFNAPWMSVSQAYMFSGAMTAVEAESWLAGYNASQNGFMSGADKAKLETMPVPQVLTFSATAGIPATADVALVMGNAAAVTLYLPQPSWVGIGRRLVVKDGGLGATYNVTLQANGGYTLYVDGAATKVINTNYGTVTLVSDGNLNWYSI